MKQLILLLFLTAPALADGSVYLGPGQTQVVLDTPPPGYTRLEVQVNYRERVEYGHENLLFGYPTTVIANTYSGFGLIDEAHGYQTAAWHMTQRDIVDHRVGVGHAGEGGDAADRRRMTARGDGLLMLVARLAQMHVHVDQAGAEHATAAIDHRRVGRRAIVEQARPEIDDRLAINQQRTFHVEPALGVDQPRIDESGAAGRRAVGKRRRHDAT